MLDNSPIHTTLSTQDWLELHDVQVLNQPLYSPDLNPIEYIQLALKRTLYKLHPEFNTIGDTEEEQEAFKAGLKEAQAAIPDTLIQKLILSILHRLATYKVAKGYQIKYQIVYDQFATLKLKFGCSCVEFYRFKVLMKGGVSGGHVRGGAKLLELTVEEELSSQKQNL